MEGISQNGCNLAHTNSKVFQGEKMAFTST